MWVRNSGFAELFRGGIAGAKDFLRQNLEIRTIVGVAEAFISELEGIDHGLVAGEKPACPHFSLSPILTDFTGRGS